MRVSARAMEAEEAPHGEHDTDDSSEMRAGPRTGAQAGAHARMHAHLRAHPQVRGET